MGILENAKNVASAVHEINNLELYQRVLNLHSDIIDLVEENSRLRIENQDLDKKLQIRGKMHFNEPFYFLDGDTTPHCPACWETNTRPIHVVKIWDSEGEIRWDCPTCKNNYVVKSTTSRRSPPAHFDSSPWG